MRYFALISALAALVLLTGCDNLTKTSTSNTIVTSYDANVRSTAQAVEEMSDSLTAFGGSRLNGAKIQLKVIRGGGLKSYAEKALRDARPNLNFQQVKSNPTYIVTADFNEISPDAFDWKMSLAPAASPQNTLWSKSVRVYTLKAD